MKVNFIEQAFSTGIIPFDVLSQKNTQLVSTASNSVSNDRTEDIQNVLDVLPHLTHDFIRKLLIRYDDTESAIAAVLEGNLPPDLMQIDSQNGENKVHDIAEKHADQIGSELADREIVKIKTQLVRPKAEKRFLDDKSAIKEFHARNIEHGYVDMPDEYDDEYDDSYDAVVESESKALSVLKKTGAINVLVDEIDDSDETDSNDETNETNEGRDRSRDFCENPEVIRERWARNRQAKYGNIRPPKPSGYAFISIVQCTVIVPCIFMTKSY